MKLDFKQLQAFREGWGNTDETACDKRVTEMLYQFYSGVSSEKMKVSFQGIGECLQNSSFAERDRIICAVVELLTEQERIAFLDGVQVGAQLALELMGSDEISP